MESDGSDNIATFPCHSPCQSLHDKDLTVVLDAGQPVHEYEMHQVQQTHDEYLLTEYKQSSNNESKIQFHAMQRNILQYNTMIIYNDAQNIHFSVS